MIAKLVEIGEVREEESPHDVRGDIDAVHVDLLILAVVCAQPNDIALIGGDEDQFVLAEESKDRGVGLPYLVSGFDGKCEMLVIAEVEAHDRVADQRRTPVGEEEIDGAKI